MDNDELVQKLHKEQDDYDERLLSARLNLGRIAHPRDAGFQARYCKYIDEIAKYYQVTSNDLASAYMHHYGSAIMKEGEING